MDSHPSRKNKNAARVGHPEFVASHPLRKKREMDGAPTVRGATRVLVDADVAGAGFDADDGATAVDFAGDVMTVVGALSEHLMVGVDAA